VEAEKVKSSEFLLAGTKNGIQSVKLCTRTPLLEKFGAKHCNWLTHAFTWKKWPLKRPIYVCVLLVELEIYFDEVKSLVII